jgi:hypothetical protein
MVAFAIDVWVFRRTHSYTTFACLSALAFLPNLVLAPITGLLVDRLNKKALLLACESLTLVVVGAAMFQLARGDLGIGTSATIILAQATAAQVRWITIGVSISTLSPPDTRSAINGIHQSLQGFSDVVAPMVAALILQVIGMSGVLTLGLIGGLLGMAGLAAIDGQRLRPMSQGSTSRDGLAMELTFGFRWICREPRMFRLLLFVMGYNLVAAVFTVSFTPYLLMRIPVQGLSVACGLEGASALLMGACLVRVGSRVRPRRQIVGGALVFGALMVAWGLARDAIVLCTLAFCTGATSSLIGASLHTEWQGNVPLEIQGKVFAARRMVSYLLIPVAVLASIPLSERLFGPLLVAIPSAMSAWGEGRGGALGLMLSALGGLLAAGSAWHAWREAGAIRRTGAVLDN